MTIIDEKYRNKYKDNKDWLSQFIDGEVVERTTREVTKQVPVLNEDGTPKMGEDGKPVTESKTETVENRKTSINLEKLFALADANGLDARARYADQADRKNAPGRLRMTIGNMLRSAARKRGGLFDLQEVWTEAPEEFMGDKTPTHNRDGSKIVVAKEDAKADGAEAQEPQTDGAEAQEPADA